jgi:hypothetical protein
MQLLNEVWQNDVPMHHHPHVSQLVRVQIFKGTESPDGYFFGGLLNLNSTFFKCVNGF